MQFDILTLFPDFFDSFLKTSIIGKAIEKEIITIRLIDIRDFSENKHKKVDDVPYGGGAGMVMCCQPIVDAIKYAKKEAPKARVIFFTPHGKTLNQEGFETIVQKKYEKIILLCGHYEGIDQRIRDHFVDEEISLGNFVLTGGEIPAQVFIDGCSRLIPGVIGKEESHLEESFSQKIGRNKVEYPHYTRPEIFEGYEVPPVLLSGNHQKIQEWRESQCQDHE